MENEKTQHELKKKELCILYVVSTANNITATLIKAKNRKVLFCYTAGKLCVDSSIPRSFRKKSDGVKLLGQVLFEKMLDLNVNYLVLYFKGHQNFRSDIVNTFLKNGKIELCSISDITNVPHNGCRGKKITRTRMKKKQKFFKI